MAPTNSFSSSWGIKDRCKLMTAAVFTNNSGADTVPTSNWAKLTGPDSVTGNYVLTIDTTLDVTLITNEDSVSKTLYIKTVLSSYNTQF